MAEKKKWMELAERLVRRGLVSEYGYEELKKEFIAFVDYYTTHPSVYVQRTRQKQKGSDKRTADLEFSGDRVERAAPMTNAAFCTWIGKNYNWIPQTIAELKRMKHPSEDDLKKLEFLQQIRTFFRTQLLEGAVVGDYSTPMVASLLALKNNVDVTSGGKSAMPIISIVEDRSTRADYDAKGGSNNGGDTDAPAVEDAEADACTE